MSLSPSIMQISWSGNIDLFTFVDEIFEASLIDGCGITATQRHPCHLMSVIEIIPEQGMLPHVCN